MREENARGEHRWNVIRQRLHLSRRRVDPHAVTLTPEEWEQARPLLSSLGGKSKMTSTGFTTLEIARLVRLRRQVSQGARHEYGIWPPPTLRHLQFTRWLVETGRLRG